jgi:hypothetical protein
VGTGFFAQAMRPAKSTHRAKKWEPVFLHKRCDRKGAVAYEFSRLPADCPPLGRANPSFLAGNGALQQVGAGANRLGAVPQMRKKALASHAI